MSNVSIFKSCLTSFHLFSLISFFHFIVVFVLFFVFFPVSLHFFIFNLLDVLNSTILPWYFFLLSFVVFFRLFYFLSFWFFFLQTLHFFLSLPLLATTFDCPLLNSRFESSHSYFFLIFLFFLTTKKTAGDCAPNQLMLYSGNEWRTITHFYINI